MHAKKSYNSPKVTFYGDIEKITFGPKAGFADALLGAVGIGDGGSGGIGECKFFPNAPGCSSFGS